MTDERRLDERMAEWLRQEPSAMPAWLVDDAVAWAEAHPQRRLPAPWRRFVDWVERPGLWGSGGRRSLVFVGIASIVLAVAATGALLGLPFGVTGPGGQPPPTAESSPSIEPSSPRATPSAESTLAPLVPTVVVGGDLVCAEVAPGAMAPVGDVRQFRLVAFSCAGSTSDLRLRGPIRFEESRDEQADGSAETWGTASIVSAGSGWAGSWIGTIAAGSGEHRLTGVMFGSGTNSGLRARYTLTIAADHTDFEGLIEDARTVPPDGAAIVFGHTCTTVASGTATAADGGTRYDGVELTCSGRPSDPRLVGQYRNSLDIVEAADESATMSGTFTIAGDAGSWSGGFTGTVDAGYSTHRVQGLLLGSGAYANLRWPISVIGTATDGYIATGVIEPAP